MPHLRKIKTTILILDPDGYKIQYRCIVRNVNSDSLGEIIELPLRNPKFLTVRMITKSGNINKRF